MNSPSAVEPAAPGRLPNPVDSGSTIRGVLFDLDGTLYDQPRMRRLMAWELFTALVAQPITSLRRLRGLRHFRQAQESLRHGGRAERPLGRAQLELAATRASMPVEELAPMVREWMDERPLKHLSSCRAAGLHELFDFLARSAVRVGVFSDYPAQAKLQALGIADYCSPVLCASDQEIGVFKPDPRGFLVACEHWGLPPSEVLMVGDRAEVDGAGAAAAGLPCVIITKQASSTLNQQGLVALDSLERLHRVFTEVVDDGR